MFEALNEFIAIIAGAAPWLLPFVVVLVWWGFANWQALNDPEKVESFTWAVTQLTNSPWEKRYLSGLGWVLDKVSSWVGDCDKLNQIYFTTANPKGVINKTFGFNPFTSESYEKCLRLAFLYPVLSFFFGWAIGGDAVVASFDWIGYKIDSLLFWQRWLVMVSVVIIIFGFYYVPVNKVFAIVFAMTLLIAVLSVFTFVGDAIGFIAIAVSISVVLALIGRKVLFGLIIFLLVMFALFLIGWLIDNVAVYLSERVAVFIVVFLSFLIMLIFKWFLWWSYRFVYWLYETGCFWVLHGLLFMVVSYVSVSYAQNSLYMILLLFWILLPLVNAPIDWLSLGMTRGLLQAVRSGHHGGWFALVWGLLDLVFALVFLFLIAAVLVLVTAMGNVVAGKILVALDEIFTELRADPWSVNHWWVYFMMLSTLVPTPVHFALAGGAATLWLPQKLRARIAHNLEHNHYKISAAWLYLTFTPAIGFLVAPALLMWLLYWLVTTNGGWLGGHLLDWAEWLALSVNPPVAVNP